jgi:hypothetical protein
MSSKLDTVQVIRSQTSDALQVVREASEKGLPFLVIESRTHGLQQGAVRGLPELRGQLQEPRVQCHRYAFAGARSL